MRRAEAVRSALTPSGLAYAMLRCAGLLYLSTPVQYSTYDAGADIRSLAQLSWWRGLALDEEMQLQKQL